MSAYVRKTFEEMENDSYVRAREQNIIVEKVTDQVAIAVNLDQGTEYDISIENNEVTNCTCPHHHYRGVNCKHMYAASFQLNVPISTDIL